MIWLFLVLVVCVVVFSAAVVMLRYGLELVSGGE